ncbi:MAG: GNAT family N-acetyltransferase [Planctomycetes bacterium]|nr:GNAT family N-acetyltransferase [Planctomycetota bacterium]
MTTRQANSEDLAAIVQFNSRMASETEGLTLDRATLTAGVRAGLGDESKAVYLVAEADGRPVGTLMLTSEWSDWRNGPIWWLQSVYVLPEWRRRGVFRALYRHAHQLARDRGAKGLRLYVESDNTAAQTTYEQVGMTRSHYLMFERVPL